MYKGELHRQEVGHAKRSTQRQLQRSNWRRRSSVQGIFYSEAVFGVPTDYLCADVVVGVDCGNRAKDRLSSECRSDSNEERKRGEHERSAAEHYSAPGSGVADSGV